MTPTKLDLILNGLWLLLALPAAVGTGYMRFMGKARRFEASRDQATRKPLSTGSILYFIVLIICACLAAFFYFRATFPH